MFLLNIQFEDEFMVFLILSSFPNSWSRVVTTVNSLDRGFKLVFKCMRDLIIGEDV